MSCANIVGGCWGRAALLNPSPLLVGQSRGLLSFSDIPKAPQYPVVGSLPQFIKAGGQSQLHNYVDNLHKKLGPMYVDNMLGKKMLFISDPEANLEVYRSEGKYPEHLVPDAWTLYLKDTRQKRGLFFMDGEEWYTNRRLLNKIILRPNSLENHVEQISSVCKDFVNIWKTDAPKDQLEFYLYCWNIECVGEIVLGKRLGFLDKLRGGNISKLKEKSIEENEFVKSIHDTFAESAKLYAWPAKLAKFLNIASWKRFCSAVTTSLQMGESYVKKGIMDCKDQNPSENVQRSILYKLLNENLREDDLSNILVDLFLASADTSSHSASWALYLLGRNPEVARKAREEIKSVVKERGRITFAVLNELSFVKGIVKEALRMFPIAMFLTRKLAKDANLSGYLVPKGTMVISSIYTMGRDPTNYTDPNSFRPERWIKGGPAGKQCPGTNILNEGKLNKRAYVPWGVGGRSCVGRRVAELELSLLIIEALQAFEWTTDEVDLIMQFIPVPDKNIELKLKSI